RLEHSRRVETELLRRLQTVGSGFGIVLIAVDTVFGVGLLQQIDGGSHAGSGALAGGQAATVAENRGNRRQTCVDCPAWSATPPAACVPQPPCSPAPPRFLARRGSSGRNRGLPTTARRGCARQPSAPAGPPRPPRVPAANGCRKPRARCRWDSRRHGRPRAAPSASATSRW